MFGSQYIKKPSFAFNYQCCSVIRDRFLPCGCSAYHMQHLTLDNALVPGIHPARHNQVNRISVVEIVICGDGELAQWLRTQ